FVSLMGLDASTVGGLLPPASGWLEKSPENVTIVPALTLKQLGLYLRVAPTGKVTVTLAIPVMSMAVVVSQPLTIVEPELLEVLDAAVLAAVLELAVWPPIPPAVELALLLVEVFPPAPLE